MQRDRAKTGTALSALIGICTRVAKGESSERDNRDPSWIMARFLAQLIMVGVQTVARAFTQTLRQEYQATVAARRAAEAAGRDGNKAAQAVSSTGITLQEAQQILNLKDIDDVETIRKNYEHLFKVNDKSSGGSFYLQSKVVRAKERIEMELDEKVCPDPTPSDETSSSPQDSDSQQPRT